MEKIINKIKSFFRKKELKGREIATRFEKRFTSHFRNEIAARLFHEITLRDICFKQQYPDLWVFILSGSAVNKSGKEENFYQEIDLGKISIDSFCELGSEISRQINEAFGHYR